jgi:hypothetical protein
MNALNDEKGNLLAQVAPVLDEAIQELGPDDREAILLRFFEHRNLRSIGETLGVTENVAQKRVARAVQELASLLHRRGVTSSATVLASSLAVGAVTAAPAGLAAAISGTVLASGGTVASMGLAAGKAAITAKLKLAVVGAIALACVATAIFLQTVSEPELGRSQFPVRAPAELVQAADLPKSEPLSKKWPLPLPGIGAGNTGSEPSSSSTPAPEPSAQPAMRNAAVPDRASAASPLLPGQRFTARSGSRVRIEGTSNMHDWQVEGSLIGGYVELGANLETGREVTPGKVAARVEAFIPIRSLKSVDKDGSKYSDRMDEIMYESLRTANISYSSRSCG